MERCQALHSFCAGFMLTYLKPEVANLATSLTVQSLFCGWTKGVYNGQADEEKVRTKEPICKLIVLNQVVALVPINTKGYGQRDCERDGLKLVKRPRPRFDNIAVSLNVLVEGE